MSFQNLSAYPLSDPNSWLENPLQDPPPEKEPRSRTRQPCQFQRYKSILRISIMEAIHELHCLQTRWPC